MPLNTNLIRRGSLFILLAAISLCSWATSTDKDSVIRIGMFHMQPELGQMAHNTQQVIAAMNVASREKVDWISTPELSLTGYYFARTIGTDWIEPGPDQYVQRLQSEAKTLGITLLLGHLEQAEAADEPLTRKSYNTLFVIDSQGEIIARHRKINTIPKAEDWSSPGEKPTLVQIDGIDVGLMICADAWPAEHAMTLKHAGAKLLFNSATWPPGTYGPGDTWAKRSRETGLPIFVNNRTGVDLTLDARQAQSVIFADGQPLLRHANDRPALIIFDWDTKNHRLVRQYVIGMQQLPLNKALMTRDLGLH